LIREIRQDDGCAHFGVKCRHFDGRFVLRSNDHGVRQQAVASRLTAEEMAQFHGPDFFQLPRDELGFLNGSDAGATREEPGAPLLEAVLHDRGGAVGELGLRLLRSGF